ncbi:hypothetical protein [Streptomyces jumonjinensis]|uniref:Uncharacterized protein n=1 Tax=Streptomyces jumonjinensis TaxID=1945 RepID=A0A646KGJ8_STRJU|nr:hypothetical protein [Streptomyces jumonjinensis]MQT01344.1 hypothetical protein [Streptomyces jumonjinensis]
MSDTENDTTLDVTSTDNYNPAPPRVIRESKPGKPAKPQDNYNPVAPVGLGTTEGPGAEAAVITTDNYNPAPPRIITDSEPAKPQDDSYTSAPVAS